MHSKHFNCKWWASLVGCWTWHLATSAATSTDSSRQRRKGSGGQLARWKPFGFSCPVVEKQMHEQKDTISTILYIWQNRMRQPRSARGNWTCWWRGQRHGCRSWYEPRQPVRRPHKWKNGCRGNKFGQVEVVYNLGLWMLKGSTFLSWQRGRWQTFTLMDPSGFMTKNNSSCAF